MTATEKEQAKIAISSSINDVLKYKNVYMKDGKIVSEARQGTRAAKEAKMGYSKALKEVSQGSKGLGAANRFMDTVKLINNNLSKRNDKEV